MPVKTICLLLSKTAVAVHKGAQVGSGTEPGKKRLLVPPLRRDRQLDDRDHEGYRRKTGRAVPVAGVQKHYYKTIMGMRRRAPVGGDTSECPEGELVSGLCEAEVKLLPKYIVSIL